MRLFPLTSRQKVVFLFTGLVFCILATFNVMLFVTNEDRWQQQKEYYLEKQVENIRTFQDVIASLEHVLILDPQGFPLYRQGVFKRIDYPPPGLSDRVFRVDGRSYFLFRSQIETGDSVVFALDVSDIVEERERFLYSMSTFSFFALAGILFVAVAFTYVLYEPIREINRRARAFVPRDPVAGQLIPLEGNPDDDLYRLSANLNQLFVRVHEETEKLARFSDDLAHEFKNKLFEVQSSIDLARAKGDPAGGLATVERYIRELASLIHALLQLSRAENVPGKAAETDLAEWIAGIDLVHDPRVHLHVASRAAVRIYPDLFSIAVANLVSNALKYGDPVTGRVDVTLGQGFLSVADNGIGIAPQDAARVWERFYKVDNARTYASGHGLGLAIVRSIVEDVHHMAIGLESELGKGTTVTIRW